MFNGKCSIRTIFALLISMPLTTAPLFAVTATELTPSTAPHGARVLVAGSGLDAADVTVAFTGATGAVNATVQSRSGSMLELSVPATAVNGSVRIAQGAQTLASFPFTVAADPAYVRVTTVARTTDPAGPPDGPGFGTFGWPAGVAVVPSSGGVFFADPLRNQVRFATAAGTVGIVAGSGAAGLVDGDAASARFRHPTGLAYDGVRRLIYVADTANHVIRKITPAGVVTTFAGSRAAGSRDGSGTTASFNQPTGLALDADGNVYVCDTGNAKIRMITPAGVVTTIAGRGISGYGDGAASEAKFSVPIGITVAVNGAIYVADSGNRAVRKVASGRVTTLVRNSTQLWVPVGLAGKDEVLYCTDAVSDHVIRITTSSADVALAAGSTRGNQDGTTASAKFNTPTGIDIAAGLLYIADSGNDAIRLVAPPPSIADVYPRSGPPSGGNVVRIFGTGFVPGSTTVRFGATTATNVSVVDGTEAMATVPAGSGTINIAVATAVGTAMLPGRYTYAAPPTITSVTPAKAPVSGGLPVTITGTNFVAGQTSVTFGTAAASGVTVVNSTTITAIVPPSIVAGTTDVVVATTAGVTTLHGGFVYVAPPVIASFSPPSGPPATAVTVTGRFFDPSPGATQVRLGAQLVAPASMTSTQIVFAVPTGATTGRIGITTIGGTVQSTVDFVVRSLTAIAVSPSAATITEGQTRSFSATGHYSDGTTADETNAASWTSSDPTRAIVSNSGVATAVAAGTAAIRANLGAISGTATLTIEPSTTSVTLSPSGVTLAVDASQAFTATANRSDGSSRDVTTTATWTSSDPAIVTVDAAGRAVAHASGNASVTATSAGKSGTASVHVQPIVSALGITPQSSTVIQGGVASLTATATYTDGTHFDVTQQATWTSSDTSVAAVSAGAVTGVAPGAATITAAYGSQTATAQVAVERVVTSIDFDPPSLTMPAEATSAIAATAHYSDGSSEDVTLRAQWSSSDESIATFGDGKIFAVADGVATFTATFGGVSGTVSVAVGVVPTSLTIDPSALTLDDQTSTFVTATLHYADGSSSDVTADASWTVVDPRIVSVNSGRISALRPGTTTITATASGQSATITATVRATLARIEITPGYTALTAEATQALHASARYSDGSAADVTTAVFWSSNNESAVSIDDAGVATAHAVGIATIFASNADGTMQGVATLKVWPELTAVTASPALAYITTGATWRVRIRGTFADAKTADVTEQATWSTSNAAIATVNARGFVTAVAQGTVTITARVGSFETSARFFVEPPVLDPPDPATIAPPNDPTHVTTVYDSTRFLYEGTPRIQTGVTPGTIERLRAAIVRGRVLARGGAALPAVRVAVAGHPEYGQTYSRSDGMFDLAVNGGEALVLDYSRVGYLGVQRSVTPAWNDWAVADDVVMTAYDAAVTNIDLSANTYQVARGSATSDADGMRRTTLLFSPGTTATMTVADGTVRSLSTITVRATEYTFGADGAAAMPAPLPPTSAYTYCVELTADEAVNAGAEQVNFSKPVNLYVENFLGFPVGSRVPAGWYDRERSTWVPSDDGRVIRIVRVVDGRAYLDVDGDFLIDDSDTLIGTTPAERERLATIYGAPGTELWRIPVTHFTPWDGNFPWALPDGAFGPDQPNPKFGGGGPGGPPSPDKCTKGCGSVVSVEARTLGEHLPIAGSPFGLSYESGRISGVSDRREIDVSLTGDEVPPAAKIQTRIDLAGRVFTEDFSPATKLTQHFQWDGRDAYGRSVIGAVPAHVDLQYVYPVRYLIPQDVLRSWAAAGRLPVQFRPNLSYAFSQHFDQTLDVQIPPRLGAWDARAVGLGGWTFDAQHFYDFSTRTLFLGNGALRTIDGVGPVVKTLAGNGASNEDNVPAKDIAANAVAVTVGPDGTVYFSEQSRIRSIGQDGTVRTIAGGGTALPTAAGVPALDVSLEVSDVALAPDGSLYFSEPRQHRVLRLQNGFVRIVAGSGASSNAMAPDDVDPTTVALEPQGISVDAGGNLYITTGSAVYIVRPDGRMQRHSGNGERPDGDNDGDGGTARDAAILNPTGVTPGPNGDLYISSPDTQNIRAVRSDGTIRTVAEGPDSTFGSSGPVHYIPAFVVDQNGLVYAADRHFIYLLRRDGSRIVIAGNAFSSGDDGDDRAALAARFEFINDLAIGPDGTLYVVDAGKIRKIAPAMPGLPLGEMTIPSEDGSEIYVFDSGGRHLRTVDARLGTTRYSFAYTPNGHLSSMTDVDGNTWSIQRSVDDIPAAIVAPGGQRTTLRLDADGYLASVSNEGGETYSLAYYDKGLLKTFTNPRNFSSNFTYDDDGLLLRDDNAASGFFTLAATDVGQQRTIVKQTAEGRVTRSVFERFDDHSIQRVLTNETGIGSTVAEHADGRVTSITPTGTLSQTSGPHPRFGMQAKEPLSSDLSIDGHSVSATFAHSISLYDPASPLSAVAAETKVATINGRQYRTEYDGGLHTFTSYTPAGRSSGMSIDAAGRPVRLERPGLLPWSLSYDARGRLERMTQGNRVMTFGYDSRNRLRSMTDPLQRTVSYDYDTSDRVVRQVLPGGNEINFTYDENGNITTLTPPGRPAHAFTYTPLDLSDRYTPPSVPNGGITEYVYNRDRQIDLIRRPDNSTIDFGYDTAGRLSSIAIGRGTYQYAYDAATGLLAGATAPDGNSLTYMYDGAMLSSVTWEGTTVRGSVNWSYDDDFAVTTEEVCGDTGCSAISYSYDDDKLLSSAGDETLSRNPANGLLTGSSMGVVNDTLGWSNFGEMTSYEASVSGAVILHDDFTRDDAGRITRIDESTSEGTQGREYTYDLSGHLETVKLNGAVVTTYTYDTSGNRRSKIGASNVDGSACDGQDRLVAYADATFSYTPNGELLARQDATGETRFSYDELGNLLQVRTANGHTVTYTIDAADRRVGRVVDGETTNTWLYADELRIVAELAASGSVIRFVYGSRAHTPDYMIKDGATYRLITDYLGSVRYVIDTSNGSVMQERRYDEFGIVTYDSAPDFQPFGFAGGLYDPLTGLVRFGARDYDPQSGRWTTPDPIGFSGGSANLYSYANSDPVNFYDPNGLLTVPLVGWVNTGENFGSAAVTSYADVLVDPNSTWYELSGAAVGGFFASLWTPCTSDATFTTLSIAAGADAFARRPYWRYIGPESRPDGRWLTRGWKPPYGTNYEAAKDALQLPKTPTGVVQVEPGVFEPISGPRTVGGHAEWGAGGGVEYYRDWRFPE